MSTHFENERGEVPINIEQLIDRLCDQFEHELRRGRVPSLHEYLAAIAVDGRSRLQQELLAIVQEYRNGESLGVGGPPERRLPKGSTQADQLASDPTDRDVNNCLVFELGRRPVVSNHSEDRVRVELLGSLLDMEMRSRAEAGENPDVAEFLERFPAHRQVVKARYLEYFIPRSIGAFHVKKLLGTGSFGRVYLATDPRLQREVAIKVFRQSVTTPEFGGLLTEARAAASLRHEGIVTIHAIQEDEDGVEFLVLDYVQGPTLEEVQNSKRFSPIEAVNLIVAVAEAVQFAHHNGVVHRDLKPANILIGRDGRPRLTDFGLALRSSDSRSKGHVAGTAAYMAPEQVRGETHLVDAQADIWAIGVILYRMLGRKLPFAGANRQQLFESICQSRQTPLTDLTPGLPPELSRITSRCLEKRIAERYASTTELLDDLIAFLNHSGAMPIANRHQTPAIASKGLSPFDGHDRDSYLYLVPGPRDRFGIPEKIRFWERRLGFADARGTCRVGLIYGPSGSGKSSLLLAGIIPRLPAEVTPLVIEATSEGFEERLLGALRKVAPEVVGTPDLVTTIMALRERTEGPKIVIAIDQFEQWLHTWDQNDTCEMVNCIRQCDGMRVQTVLVVRDEFWMSARRFFRAIDQDLIEGQNALSLDLFDRSHATTVLTAFGKAAGRLPLDSDPTGEAGQFIARAIDGVSENGQVVPVRLCILAEMIKNRDWHIATLNEIDSQGGLGMAFLNSTFQQDTISPSLRELASAARNVLERFVAESEAFIRGHSISVEELFSASELTDREELQRLLFHLDRDLHLLTPVLQPSDCSQQYYQLTHDFLVPAIRDWLQIDRRRTARGRAEVRLVEYAQLYQLKPIPRHLPSMREWGTILGLSRSRKWTSSQRQMMRAASSRHIRRLGLTIAALLAVVAFAYLRINAVRTEGLIQALVTTDAAGFSEAVQHLISHRSLAASSLRSEAEAIKSAAAASESDAQSLRLLAGASIVLRSDAYAKHIAQGLLLVDTPNALSIIMTLAPHGRLASIWKYMRSVHEDANATAEQQLRASAVLAQMSSAANDDLPSLPNNVVEYLLQAVAKVPANQKAWTAAFMPASEQLVPALRQQLLDDDLDEANRTSATRIFCEYQQDNLDELLAVALDSGPAQLDVLLGALAGRHGSLRQRLEKIVNSSTTDDSDELAKDHAARQQANAMVLLRVLGDPSPILPALQHKPDPRLRAFLLDYFQQSTLDNDEWVRRLSTEPDPGIKQALLLITGAQNAIQDRDLAIKLIVDAYMSDPDSGVHGSAAWALRQLGCEQQLQKANKQLIPLGLRPGFRWYIAPNDMTMIVVDAPGKVPLGSPDSEPGQDASDEQLREFEISWSFAISATEVTQADFMALCSQEAQLKSETAPAPDCPAHSLLWSEAMRYCRLLSEAHGFPENEMVAPVGNPIKSGTFADFRTHTGYRLPIEAEWEFVCRAGTITARPFGFAPQLLPKYCCFARNANGQTMPVASLIPNQFGAFDMLGNVAEWCLDFDQKPTNEMRDPGYSPLGRYLVRGNDFQSYSRVLRSANRRSDAEITRRIANGFRVARTVLRDTKKTESLDSK